MRYPAKYFLQSVTMILLCIVTVSLQGVLGDAGDPALITLQRKNIKASSVLLEKGKPPLYYAADRAMDGKTNTAWCASQADAIPGASIEMEFAPAAVRTVHVLGGYGTNIALCRHNNRIKGYELTFMLTSGRMVTVRGELNDRVCTTYFNRGKDFDGSIEEWCKNPCVTSGGDCAQNDPKKIQDCVRKQETLPVGWVGTDRGGVSGIGEISTPDGELLCVKGIKLKILSIHPGRGSKGTCDTCVSEIVLSPGAVESDDVKEFRKKCK